MNAVPVLALVDSLVTTIGYLAMTLMSSGIGTPSAWSPAARTSVWYTMPASASPVVTLVTMPLTFCSSDTGVTATPAASSTCWVYLPIGTSGAAVTNVTPDLARSATDVMPFGLPLATMISSLFVAKTTGSPWLFPASVSLVMFASSAEANTSAGAPWLICVTRAEEASKLNVTFESGCSVVKAVPISLNDSVSEAAANTVMLPDAAGVDPAGLVVAAPDVVVALAEVVVAFAVVVVAPAVVVAAAVVGAAVVAAAAVV